MFGNSFLTSKYLKKLQQGGGISIPDPARFRTPIQGINPSVFNYDINTKPLDVSPMLQVMQTKDSMDMAREKAALEREKLKAEADLEKSKLQHQQNKMMMDFMGDMFKVTGDASMSSAGTPLYAGNDLTTSKRYAPIYQQWQTKESEIVTDIAKSMSAPVGSTQASTVIMNKMLELQRHRQNAPTTMQMGADHKSMENFWTTMSGNSKDKNKKMNGTLAMRALKQREEFLNGVDNGYELGMSVNNIPGLVYDNEYERKKLDDIYAQVNKPIEQEFMDSGGGVITTKKTKKTLDPKLASQAILDRVWGDASQRSYLSDLYGMDLWDVDQNNEARVKELLRDKIEKTIQYDDQLYGGATGVTTDISAQILPTKDKTVTMNYNVAGGTTKNINKTVTPLDSVELPKNVSTNTDGSYDVSGNPDTLKKIKAYRAANKISSNNYKNVSGKELAEALSPGSTGGTTAAPAAPGTSGSATAKTPQELAREQFPGMYKQMEEVDKGVKTVETKKKKEIQNLKNKYGL